MCLELLRLTLNFKAQDKNKCSLAAVHWAVKELIPPSPRNLPWISHMAQDGGNTQNYIQTHIPTCFITLLLAQCLQHFGCMANWVCLETRNTLGKVETSSLIWGFYQRKGKGLVLPRFLTDHNCSSNVFWANFHICFAPHSLPTFHFPSFTEFYISSWFSAQLVQTPQFRKASFCTEVLGLFFFSISF